MKFTDKIKEKVWRIAQDCLERDYPNWMKMSVGEANGLRRDWFERKGYPIVRKQASYNTKTKRRNWGSSPRSSKSIFYLLGEARMPTDVRIRYWVEIPNELAEKILILEHV